MRRRTRRRLKPRRIVRLGIGLSAFLGRLFFGALSNASKQEQIPRYARDDRFLVLRRLQRIAIESITGVAQKNGAHLRRKPPKKSAQPLQIAPGPQERESFN